MDNKNKILRAILLVMIITSVSAFLALSIILLWCATHDDTLSRSTEEILGPFYDGSLWDNLIFIIEFYIGFFARSFRMVIRVLNLFIRILNSHFIGFIISTTIRFLATTAIVVSFSKTFKIFK